MEKPYENLLKLEEQIDSVELDALREEGVNVRENYRSLRREYDSIGIPFPEVSRYSVGSGLDEIADIQHKKKMNEQGWKKQETVERYLKHSRLHIGHLHLENGTDCFFMDSPILETKTLDQSVLLINADDRRYAEYIRMWRYPAQYDMATFSRNISMSNFAVTSVDIVLDKSNEILSNITDSYLRKALMRNKDNHGIQSIIQTIQEKQDDIRLIPKHQSFIVQGCAGSGKTMVLLHRLRYLIFNNEIGGEDYILLVPSNGFKNFIRDISSKFRINYRSIYTPQSYYRMLAGKRIDGQEPEENELVFGSEYLSRVYSRHFLQECYRSVFAAFEECSEALIEFCENRLNQWIEQEKIGIEEELNQICGVTVSEAKKIAENLIQFTGIEVTDVKAVHALIKSVEDTYLAAKREFDKLIAPDVEIVISPDDKRIKENRELARLEMAVAEEQVRAAKASIFTVASHRKKLAKLREQYDETYQAFEKILIEQDKRSYAERISKLRYVYEGVTLEETEQILAKLKHVYDEAKEKNEVLVERQKNFEVHIGDRYQKEIEMLNQMIDSTSNAADDARAYVVQLEPAYWHFAEKIKNAGELLSYYTKGLSRKEIDETNKRFKLFAKRTEQQLRAYLNTMLFNICAKKIKTEFDIKICNLYKHYWYLTLYCQYLLNNREVGRYHYIYIDEAQDLSATELELIYKINSKSESYGEFHTVTSPVMNVFGDVNQTVTAHGLASWDILDFIKTQYTLNENFRNTNQIIEYCNRNLPFQMKKIGVDMDAVYEFNTFDEARRWSQDIHKNTVLIVKDEYAKADLEKALERRGISSNDIYTVKAAKGLEFKRVCVFDRDMTENERYIAYTRALAKLFVVKTLPYETDSDAKLYIEGEEVTEVS